MYPAGEGGIASRFLTLSSGERVHVIEAGPADGVPVLLCHGWGACVYAWSAILPALVAGGCRVLAPDLRGHGRTDESDARSAYTTPGMTAHLAAIVDALGIDRPVVVGHSMSGRIALEYAMVAPNLVRGLVLLAPIGVGSLRWFMRWTAPLLALGARLGPIAIPRWVIRVVAGAATGRLRRPSARDIDEYWAPSQWRKFGRAIHRLLIHFDWSALPPDRIARLPFPVAVVLGELDPLVVIDGRETFAARLAPQRVVTVARAGHIVTDEIPGVASEEILRLVAGLVATRD
ncbi:MAG: alpha/beta hydrolase [Gemmatimonadaceae bacterium]|nr:alpha/beta hydrolase [Gemmatimonadaceae bacterium]NUQ92337.1 alpha/beta hydrolase [Gemmatimonadaceae bacterium]NUR21007.1 alpha/beta hydrolase [Gemmatimonadaceae bacterium]NUS98236.1 alpha/beta hydrolase [Gemmatimonadaceae bacterium]